MNTRKLKKAIKRLRNLPKGKYFFIYGFNKMKQLYYRITHSTKVAYPSTIMLELTNHCNLHCTTCPREYDFGKQMDLGFIDIWKAKKVIDEIWPYLDSIGLTGMGETFLYKDIEHIVDYIKMKNRGIIISLSTNAMTTDFLGSAKKVIGKVDTIQVSIDGLGNTYETIRKNASFDRLRENLKLLIALCANSETTIMLNMVITKENYHQMHEIVDFSESIGIHYLNFTPFNLCAVTNIEQDYYRFFKSQPFIDELKRVEAAKLKNPNGEVTGWDFKVKNEFKRCLFPWTHFYICWDGFLAPCCSKPFPKELHFGNTFEKGTMSCINSESFMKFRELWYMNQNPTFCDKCHFMGIEPIETNA